MIATGVDPAGRMTRLINAKSDGTLISRFTYSGFVKTIQEATGNDHDKHRARQDKAWDDFVNQTWAGHRPTLGAPTDAWKQKHDDRYYRAAVEQSQ